MGKAIPDLSWASFEERIQSGLKFEEISGLPTSGLPSTTVQVLFEHFQELRRWNPKHNLIGPGTVESVPERHYQESLMGLPWLRRTDRTLVDLGTGAGFPGFVLAAACPFIEATLIDARTKKCAFLDAARRRASLSGTSLNCRSLNARIEKDVPEGAPAKIDVITCRALKLEPGIFELFLRHSPAVRFILWSGQEKPAIPSVCSYGRRRELPGSDRRYLLEVLPHHPRLAADSVDRAPQAD